MATVLLLLLFIFLVWNFYCMKRAEGEIRRQQRHKIDDLEHFVERRSGYNRGWD